MTKEWEGYSFYYNKDRFIGMLYLWILYCSIQTVFNKKYIFIISWEFKSNIYVYFVKL